MCSCSAYINHARNVLCLKCSNFRTVFTISYEFCETFKIFVCLNRLQTSTIPSSPFCTSERPKLFSPSYMSDTFLPLFTSAFTCNRFIHPEDVGNIFLWNTVTNKGLLLRVQVFSVVTVISRVIDSRSFEGTYSLLINAFAASYLNTQGLNNSCLKSPASTLVDLTFQSRALRSFSLNQLFNLSL